MYISCNYQGNVHQCVQYVNTLKSRAFLFQIVYLPSGPPACIIIFKAPAREDMAAVCKEIGVNPP